MTTTITEEVDVEAAITRSPIDGRIVIEIDAKLDDPDEEMRIFLNDGPIWIGSPENDNSALYSLEQIDKLFKDLRTAIGAAYTQDDSVLAVLNAIEEQLSDHRGHGI